MTLKIAAAMSVKSKNPVIPESLKGVKDFKEVLNQQRELQNQPAVKTPDLFKEIQEIQKSILNGKELTGKDLILYQIKTGHYSLRVELISKVAEAAVSTVKKFQNPQ